MKWNITTKQSGYSLCRKCVEDKNSRPVVFPAIIIYRLSVCKHNPNKLLSPYTCLWSLCRNISYGIIKRNSGKCNVLLEIREFCLCRKSNYMNLSCFTSENRVNISKNSKSLTFYILMCRVILLSLSNLFLWRSRHFYYKLCGTLYLYCSFVITLRKLNFFKIYRTLRIYYQVHH